MAAKKNEPPLNKPIWLVELYLEREDGRVAPTYSVPLIYESAARLAKEFRAMQHKARVLVREDWREVLNAEREQQAAMRKVLQEVRTGDKEEEKTICLPK